MKGMTVNDKKVIDNIRTLISISVFLAPIVYLLAYVFYGVSEVFGDSVNIIEAVDLTISLFRVSSMAVYRPIFGCALGVTYFVILVIIIKNIINSIGSLKDVLKKDGDDSMRSQAIVCLMDNFGKTLFSLVLYMVLSRMVFSYSLSVVAIAIIATGIVIHIASRIGVYIIERKELVGALYYQLLCNGVVAVAVTVLLFCICRVDMYSVFNGFNVFNIGFGEISGTEIVSLLLTSFFEPIAFIILQIYTLVVTKQTLVYLQHYSIDESTVKKLMITSISVCAILVAVSIYVSGNHPADMMFYAIKPYISILACSVTIFLSLSLPKITIEEDKIIENNTVEQQPASAEPTEISEKPDEENSEISSK